jgi:hypothetical protein
VTREKRPKAAPERCAANSFLRALPLSLEPQALAHLLKGGFHLPSPDEPRDDLLRLGSKVSAQQGLGFELALRVANQYPTQGHGGQTRALYQMALSETISTVRSTLPYQLATVI